MEAVQVLKSAGGQGQPLQLSPFMSSGRDKGQREDHRAAQLLCSPWPDWVLTAVDPSTHTQSSLTPTASWSERAQTAYVTGAKGSLGEVGRGPRKEAGEIPGAAGGLSEDRVEVQGAARASPASP